jgi:hypothetical protein
MKAFICIGLFLLGSQAFADYDSDEMYVLSPSYLANETLSLEMAKNNIVKHFDKLCGDIWCEGTYATIKSLEISCTVDKKTSLIENCSWIFAGCNTQVDEVEGTINLDSKIFNCKFKAAHTLKDFATRFAQSTAPLDEPLEDNFTLMGVLNHCLQ